MTFINKINVKAIVLGHLETLKDAETGSRANDVTLFYLMPLAASGTCAALGITLTANAIDVLTNALAIMAGLLFNLLVVLQGLSASPARPRNERVRAFTKEVYNNIAYAIIASLSALVPLVIAAGSESPQRSFVIASAVAIALVVHFALTMFMVLKRMHAMLSSEFQ
ncbi:hypothetical protein UFOVP998_61 [uncultured Caudovirales phage]|uniref:Uncharacterized protein n=1 Tax=uncultured Caudovirales phage TaxID=2100421 RepID=A0A6J5SEP8_9CAUD|nr:hypothetical protein UFOVP998_61 [uncultured Caudovirales phage]CAB4199550.1 hypothetical protein UFOVP1331_60 [uncultured Caudovirales phage]CAB4212626.1 hypothetical protein UFOVP1442_15 [uncultured Caudovirales phage]CAB5228060.1 hypothetical protein UFOVP1535_36 [uncultured Caudovirales phage]